MTKVLPGPMHVWCPICNAPPNQGCFFAPIDSVYDVDYYHPERVNAAKTTNPYPQDELLRMSFPSVDEFATLMRRELWANRRKGDRSSWRKISTWVLWVEVSYHSAKLAVAVKTNDKDKIRELTADTANMLMMLADSAGLLDEN